jgi:LPS sulfotransferase NodH
MSARQCYLICCLPRTGSWLLSEALESTGLAGRPREYFGFESYRDLCHNYGVNSRSPLEAVLSRLMDRYSTPNGVFGAKMHWVQFQFLAGLAARTRTQEWPAVTARLSAALPRLQYIWLTRRDKLRQAISYYRALRTNVWWDIRGNGGTDVPPAAPPLFDFCAIDELKKSLLAQEREWVRLFAVSGATPLTVYYEDMARDLSRAVTRILNYLDLSDATRVALSQPRLRLQRDELTEGWVSRYCACLNSERL